MRTSSLTQALPIVGSALGRKFGVRVEVQGQRACTDGSRIVIPAFDPQTPVQRTLAWGYLSHEAAHVRYTDFDAMADSAQGSPWLKRLTNLLEDVRIEKALNREYPGTRHTLAEVVRQCVQDGDIGAPALGDPPANVLHDALLTCLRYQVLGQGALKDEADKAGAVLQQTFPQGALTRLNGLLSQVPDLGSTRDCLDLSRKILAMLEEEAQPPSSPQAGEQQQEGIDPSIQDSGSGEIASESGQADKHCLDTDDSDDHSVNAEAQSSGDTGQEALKELLQADETDIPGDPFDAIAARLEDWSQASTGSALSAVTTTPKVLLPGREDVGDEAQALLQKVSAESARLSAQLTGLVQARTLCRDRITRKGRKLDSHHLHRVALDDSRLFRQRAESVAIDSHVHLCLDISGSMSSRLPLAREAVLALSLALSRINGVTLSASAFPGDSSSARTVFSLLSVTEPVKSLALRLVSLNHQGTTPMATGLWHSVHQVLSVNTARRLIMMITDGEPDEDHQQPMRDLLRRCKGTGIEVIGIGIQCSYVEDLFPQSLVIHDLGQLKDGLFRQARLLLAA